METNHNLHNDITGSSWTSLYTIGGVSAWLQLASILAILAVSFVLGADPDTAAEWFALFHKHGALALFSQKFGSILMIALYLGTFPSLYIALRHVHGAYTALATLGTFIGVAICFATSSGLSLLHLSQQYAMAITDAQRAQLLAAGEAVLAADMWHSSGGFAAGILLQGSGVLISLVMLKSRDFSKVTAWTGLLGNGFDLVQHLLHLFVPATAGVILMIAGPFYLVWFPMLARDLLRLGRGHSKSL